MTARGRETGRQREIEEVEQNPNHESVERLQCDDESSVLIACDVMSCKVCLRYTARRIKEPA